MRAGRVLLGILMLAAAVTAAANIFSDSVTAVTVCHLTTENYAPAVYVSGTLEEQKETAAAVYGAKTSGGRQMLVTAWVSEDNISRLRVGQQAMVTGGAFPGRSYSAVVMTIGDSAKKTTLGGTKAVAVEVRLRINEADAALKSGFTARVRILTEDESPVSVVPYSAVLQDENGEYVYLYEDGRARRVNIETGDELLSGFELLTEFEPEDRVILNAADVQKNGSPVSLQKEV